MNRSWADSDKGSTSVLQAESWSSILHQSTKMAFWCNGSTSVL